MKACPATRVLREMLASGIWIDAGSGNEVLRARRAGFAGGCTPPQILLTADVFRDNALEVLCQESVLPNLGSPGQLAPLLAAGWRGPVGLRVNPGFGHGHVAACDTGGPSSKHGVWVDDALAFAEQIERAGLPVALLHAHVGSGPRIEEFDANAGRLVEVFAEIIGRLPSVDAVNFGGGLPFSYRDPAELPDLLPLGRILVEARDRFSRVASRPIRVEIEPGRFFVAPAATLVATVTDLKSTQANEKGAGFDFLMVDAGFCDLIRPAMYGSFHRIDVVGEALGPKRLFAVAGPLCESGDVFTRDAGELIEPRLLAEPQVGDLMLLHDVGAYGAAMSSNYNSLGRAPQVWLENGVPSLISRRETLEDLLASEGEQSLRARGG
jgi:diaminopimelate decarboxylase